MSEENNVPNCRQRFKAIEGFFRRIAFNLGNSPSQTEVKIISCIPIDVTDLQQKIFQLQKELEEAKNNENKETKSNQITSVVHTAICTACPTCNARCDEQTNEEVICNEGFCQDPSVTAHIDWPDTSSRHQRSTVSFLCPSVSSRKCPYLPETVSNPINTESHRNPCECRRKFFSRKKKRCKTQLIYCAQANTNTPFCNSLNLSDDATSKLYTKSAVKNVHLGATYLEEIARRQYKAVPVVDAFSNVSDFSTPVCRDDNIPTYSQNSSNEPDLCSCCHGQFQNIDNHMNHRSKMHVYPKYDTVENYRRDTYYDSNFYDLVPVKEKSVKIRNDFEVQKRKETKSAVAKFWPQDVRPRPMIPPTKVVNYCSTSPVEDYYRKKAPNKSHNKRAQILNTMAAKRVTISPPHQQRELDPTKVCCIDFSPVYKKQFTKNTKHESPTTGKTNNESVCLPTANDNSTCSHMRTVREENPPEDKTETTLNQIKNILQTVLTEVKTSAKLGKSPDLVKKDAVVQNGPSQSNMFEASQLMQSYTFSPYSIDPYIASCSRQLPNNNNLPACTFPGMQAGRLMQHYPLLIQPQKPMCTSCFRNTQVTASKSGNTKRAASAATNTEQTQERSKETEHLIQEIYKSIALDVDVPPAKDKTVGKYTKLKSNVKGPIQTFKVENDEESKHVAAAISEIFRNPKPLDSSNTKNTETADSTPASNEASDESEPFIKNRQVVKKVYRYAQKAPKDISTTETAERDIETEQISHDLESEEQSDATIVNKEIEPSESSETETDDVVHNVKESIRADDTKREKSGIFKKMLKIFKPRQRRRKKEEVVKEVPTESESDSDDYQTIYSQKVVAPKHKKVAVRSRPHSKVFHSKQVQQRRSRTRSPEKNIRNSPYMEQEYRRYWDEKLMFHENKGKIYSTDTYRAATETPRNGRPVYYQNYEARTAIVPVRQVPLRMPGNALKSSQVGQSKNSPNRGGNNPKYSGSKSVHPGNRTTYSRQRPNEIVNRLNYPGNIQSDSPNYGIRNTNNPDSNGIKPHFITTKSGRLLSTKGLSWLKKRKLAIQCGQQWKELILEG